MAKKMWIFCGSDEPQKAFPPFMLGSGALALDMELNLFFTMNGQSAQYIFCTSKVTVFSAANAVDDNSVKIEAMTSLRIRCFSIMN